MKIIKWTLVVLAGIVLGILLLQPEAKTYVPKPAPIVVRTYPTPSPVCRVVASARCRDGSFSYSQNRRGTCSWHGGVAQWSPVSCY